MPRPAIFTDSMRWWSYPSGIYLLCFGGCVVVEVDVDVVGGSRVHLLTPCLPAFIIYTRLRGGRDGLDQTPFFLHLQLLRAAAAAMTTAPPTDNTASLTYTLTHSLHHSPTTTTATPRLIQPPGFGWERERGIF